MHYEVCDEVDGEHHESFVWSIILLSSLMESSTFTFITDSLVSLLKRHYSIKIAICKGVEKIVI